MSYREVKQLVFEGGLGVRDLHLFNDALLDKWLSGLVNEKGNLWRTVFTVKYAEDGFRWSPLYQMVLMVSLWKYTPKGCEKFSPHFLSKVGGGSTIF